MGRRFGCRADRGAAEQPPWLVAPGYAPSSVPAHEAADWSEPQDPGLLTAGVPSFVPAAVPEDRTAPPAPAAPPWPAPGEAVSYLPGRDTPGQGAAADPPTVPDRGAVAPTQPSPARPYPGPLPGASEPVVAMHAGTRIQGEDGSQLWIPPSHRARPRPRPDRPRNGYAAPAPRAGALRRVEPADGELRVLRSGAGGRSPRALLERSLSALEPIGEAEASAFAARFAADYLSWDEDNPTKRAEVLCRYLADPRAATLGWSGAGRQRADVVLPGRTLRTSDDVIVVEVTVRVTTYQRDCPRPADPEPPAPVEPPFGDVGPSCAPPPHAEGWRAVAAHWVRIAAPVTRDHTGALVVDIGPAPDPENS
ncbi:hypothetical protein [Pseudonocardia acidicola]|uniref:Uncharacterized protein n=1 Tax=Pseudonocardia acidicola TaxID=2724939 RepID=A0ABX1SJE0_9PSEU|nr:hypothetical protein [Pseudonocardia acidicola]NMI00633.1 hypothetical protein [Pseudonocardia acidicola]